MTLLRYLNQIYWLFFLLLVVLIPLPFGSFDPFYWSLFGMGAAGLLALYSVTTLMSAQSFPKALQISRYVLLFMIIQVLYVAWQSLAQGDFSTGLTQDASKLSATGASHAMPSWFVADSALSANPNAAIEWLAKAILAAIMFVLGLCLIDSRTRIKWVIYVVCCSAVLHAGIGLIAKYSAIQLVSAQSVDGHFSVSRGLFVNRNHYAAMINYGLAMLAVGGFYAIYSRSTLKRGFKQHIIAALDLVLSRKLMWLSAVLLSIICLNFSTSRAAMLGLFGSLVMVACLASFFDEKFRLKLKWLLLLLVVLVVILFFGGASGVLSRFQDGLLSIGERQEQWRITWSIIQQHWVLGTGAGTYIDAFQYYRDFSGLRQTIYDQAHSVFLQTLMEQGMIGFTLWLSSLLAIFILLLRGFRNSQSRYIRSVILGCLVALLTAILQALVDFNLLLPALNVYFYVIAATGLAASVVYSNQSKAKNLDR